jgi:uncharacterized protein YbjQ (UPF0145 family)
VATPTFYRSLRDQAGADAVIGVRYDGIEVMQGVTEVLCYGTAVQLEKAA